MTRQTDNIDNRFSQVRQRIADAAENAGRPADEVTLVAVSKTFDGAAIQPVIEAGQCLFGENRVQEAMGKWPALLEQYPKRQIAPYRTIADQQGA